MLLEQGPGNFCKFALSGGRSFTAELPWGPARCDGLSGMMKQQSEMQHRPSSTCCERFIFVQPSIMRLACVQRASQRRRGLGSWPAPQSEVCCSGRRRRHKTRQASQNLIQDSPRTEANELLQASHGYGAAMTRLCIRLSSPRSPGLYAPASRPAPITRRYNRMFSPSFLQVFSHHLIISPPSPHFLPQMERRVAARGSSFVLRACLGAHADPDTLVPGPEQSSR